MKIARSFLALALVSIPLQASADEAPAVVTSIKPVHSLVSGVMEGVGRPELLVDGFASPHTYTLRPSQARALEAANAVFIMGEGLENFLEKPLESLADDATVVTLIEAPGVARLKFREGGPFETHDHDHGHDDHGHGDDDHHDHGKDEHAHKDDHGHDHDHKDEHAHEDKHDHGHKDEHAHEDKHDHGHKDEHAHEEKHDHAGHDDHGEIDPHAWLDPVNAGAMVREIARVLSELDPAHAARYAANAEKVLARLDALNGELAEELAPVEGRPFVIFHDAYQYMERRYGLNAVGSITVNPEVAPGAQRVAEIRDKLKDVGAACVFSEPQFKSNLVGVVTEGTNVNGGVLDPLGSGVEAGPDQYFTMMRDMAGSFRACLAPRS